MSSLRNAVKRVTHKERAQPASRKKFGLLEKHKDYVIRSQDYHQKKKIIKTLKSKAENRNPDEFYFNMNKSQVVDGVHKKSSQDATLDTDVVKSLKTQDLGYIFHKKAIDDKKIEKMKSNLHLIDASATNRHKIFVEQSSEVDSFDPAAHFQVDPRLVDRVYNRAKMDTIAKDAESMGVTNTPVMAIRQKIISKADKTYAELKEREKRSEKLTNAMNHLTAQRNVMGKGTKRKVPMKDNLGQDIPDKFVFKWKRIRQK